MRNIIVGYSALSELFRRSTRLSRGDVLRFAPHLPLAIIFRAFGAANIARPWGCYIPRLWCCYSAPLALLIFRALAPLYSASLVLLFRAFGAANIPRPGAAIFRAFGAAIFRAFGAVRRSPQRSERAQHIMSVF